MSSRKRSTLTTIAIAIGIAAVVLLTSLGQGVQRFVMAEFTQFGTNLIGITPGKTTTMGMSGAVVSNVRPLTIADADAIYRIPGVTAISPAVQGNAKVEHGRKSRRTMILGVSAEATDVWQIKISVGRFLPQDSSVSPRAFAVLGSTLKKELFGNENALGKKVRISGESFRIVGILESKGQMLGFDLDDAIYLPAGRAMSMFNRESLMEIDVLYAAGLSSTVISDKISKLLIQRHGSEDFTIISQDEMLDVLGGILEILTVAVAAIGGISLLVGAIGILTIMTIAVNERIPEIGLLRAIGATRSQIRWLFVTEAILLSLLGGVAGLLAGYAGALLIGFLSPVPASISGLYALYAVVLSVVVGILAGTLPAQRAANMNPIDALRSE